MAWVKKYEPKPWVETFSQMGGEFPKPSVLENHESAEFQDWVTANSHASGTVAILGILVAIVVLAFLCCCFSAKSKNRRRPNCICPLVWAIITFGLAFGGAMAYLATGEKALDLVVQQLDHLTVDVTKADEIGQKFNESGRAIQDDLDYIPRICPEHARGIILNATEPVKASVSSATHRVAEYTDKISDLPQQLKDAEEPLKAATRLVVGAFLLPLFMIALPVLTLCLAICCTRASDSLSCAKCLDCFALRCSAPFIALTVLVVSVITSIECYMAITTSSFCLNVDTNVVTYVHHFAENNTELANIAAFYIKGPEGGRNKNNLLEKLNEAKTDILSVEDLVAKLKDLISPHCPNWDPAQLEGNTKASDNAIADAIKFLEPATIYKYYQEPIHDGLCRTLPASLGWLITTQIIVCFICLPVFAILTAYFFRRFEAWKANASSDSLLESSDSEEDSEEQGLTGATWQYDGKGWEDFDEDCQSFMELRYNKFKEGRAKAQFTVDTKGMEIAIDLSKMTSQVEGSKKVRKIRRVA